MKKIIASFVVLVLVFGALSMPVRQLLASDPINIVQDCDYWVEQAQYYTGRAIYYYAIGDNVNGDYAAAAAQDAITMGLLVCTE